MMVTLGTDAHKESHTIGAVDDVGAEIGSVTVPAKYGQSRSFIRTSTAVASLARP